MAKNINIAYVVGDEYSTLAQLPSVLTATQFFTGVLDGSLPLNLVWLAGQGLNSVEQNLLQLCKAYRPEICFHHFDEERSLETKQVTALLESTRPKNIFVKAFKIIAILMQAGKKSMTRLYVFR